MRFQGLYHMLSFYASESGNRTALIYEAVGEKVRLSYFELFDLVQRRANDLRASGKTSLGILCDGSFECVLTIMASIVSGMQTVLLDENTPDALLKGYIAYTDIDCLWSSDEEFTGEFSPYLTGGVKSGGRVLFFTSGTTSRSKAVVLTDESLMSSAFNGGSLLPLSEDDVLLCQLPLNHVFGFVCGLLWGLSCGAAVALGRGARHYIDDCAFFAPTAISVVPMLLGFLLKHNSLNERLSAAPYHRLRLDRASRLVWLRAYGDELRRRSQSRRRPIRDDGLPGRRGDDRRGRRDTHLRPDLRYGGLLQDAGRDSRRSLGRPTPHGRSRLY